MLLSAKKDPRLYKQEPAPKLGSGAQSGQRAICAALTAGQGLGQHPLPCAMCSGGPASAAGEKHRGSRALDLGIALCQRVILSPFSLCFLLVPRGHAAPQALHPDPTHRPAARGSPSPLSLPVGADAAEPLTHPYRPRSRSPPRCWLRYVRGAAGLRGAQRCCAARHLTGRGEAERLGSTRHGPTQRGRG